MSIWSKLIGIKKTEDRNNIIGNKTTSVPCSTHNYIISKIKRDFKRNKKYHFTHISKNQKVNEEYIYFLHSLNLYPYL